MQVTGFEKYLGRQVPFSTGFSGNCVVDLQNPLVTEINKLVFMVKWHLSQLQNAEYIPGRLNIVVSKKGKINAIVYG